MPETRAIVFDLDDTLYPLEWFGRSGFLAAARLVEGRFGVSRRTVMRVLERARRSHPGREFQALCAQFGLPETIVPDLVAVVRQHRPSLRLPILTSLALHQLRPFWRIGVLTNGMPAVQRRKVEALGLMPLVDTIVYADEHVQGGKPQRDAFEAVRARLAVASARTVFVGDDPVADIGGASAVGFHTIHLSDTARQWPAGVPEPDARVWSLESVPRIAERLLARREAQDVA